MFLYNFHLLIIANHDKTDVILKTNFLFYSANIYMCTCWVFSLNCWNCGKESRFLTIHTKSKRKQISSVVLSKYEFRAYWHCKIFYLQRRKQWKVLNWYICPNNTITFRKYESRLSLSQGKPMLKFFSKRSWTGPVDTKPEKNWKTKVSIWKRMKCFSFTLRQRNFLKATITGHFGFVFEETTATEIIWLS